MHDKKRMISIVTPCYNEEDNIRDCYTAVREVFETDLTGYNYEHVFCDNASTDRTATILKGIAREDKRVKLIVNSRNFGPFRSTFNGLLNTKGDAVVVLLAADLQDPPALIADFVQKWEEGYQIVYGIRERREENPVIAFGRKMYYRLIHQLADVEIPPDVGEFQLIDRVVVEALRTFDDYYPFIRGMIASCGFRTAGLPYVWKRRRKGFSKNSFFQLVDQGLNGLISFTNIPLRLCMFFGFFLAALSITYALIQLVINLIFFRTVAPPGIATLIVGLFFFSGVQLFFLGFLGEYIGAIHFQVRKRPLVIEKEKINFD